MESEDAWRLTDKLQVEHGRGDPFAAAIRATRMAMLITDPRQPDNPIVFANDSLLRLTGYEREEIVGRNCRFLQGPDTDRSVIDDVRAAIKEGRDIAVDILNYRKNGEPFWNALYISPVRNDRGELVFFFSSQLDVTDRKTSELRAREEKDRFEQEVSVRTAELRTALADLASANAELKRALDAKTVLLHEVDHRVKNNLQIIASLIGVQHRRLPKGSEADSLRATLRRVEALATVHRRLYQSEDVRRFAAGAFLRDLVSDLAASNTIPLELDLGIGDVEIAASKAAPLALTLNEIMGVHLQALPAEGGRLKVDLKLLEEQGEIEIDVRSNAVAPPNVDGGPTFERTVLNALSRQLGAQLERYDSQSERVSRIRIAAT